MDSSIKDLYKIFDSVSFPECIGCSKCCYLPCLLDEEYNENSFFKNNVTSEQGVYFIKNNECCIYKDKVNKKCKIYKKRPMDCRTFPLDIVMENGEFWWCIFKNCPQYEKLEKRLIPLIEKIESTVSRNVMDQFKRQVIANDDIYLPQKGGDYKKISKIKFIKKSK